MTGNLVVRDVRNLLAVLLSSVICAFLLSFLFVYYYGPSGRYVAGAVLLDPSIIKEIDYQDHELSKGKKLRFIFDRIEFSYFDSKKKTINTFSIPFKSYQRFYERVSSEKSVQEIPEDIKKLFLGSYPAALTINMRSKVAQEGVSRSFQVVQLIAADYFRVQLHEKKEGEWVYFYQKNVYQQSMSLFNSPPKNEMGIKPKWSFERGLITTDEMNR